MDISKTKCANCDQAMQISKMHCGTCGLVMEGDFEVPALAQLSLEDQVFVIAFVRHHGSIKKMERLFGISYPTVKNRLHAIGAAFDRSFAAPSPNLMVLEQLEAGEITVDEALERMS